MHTHRAAEIYICEVNNCDFESETKDDILAHKTSHTSSNHTSYAEKTKYTGQNLQGQGQNSWVGPIKNGKPPRKTLSYSNSSSHEQNTTDANNRYHYYNNYSDSLAGPHKHYTSGNIHNKTKSNTIKGSNSNSSLSVAPRPHWAKIFATRFKPGTDPTNIKNDLEYNIQQITGKSMSYN